MSSVGRPPLLRGGIRFPDRNRDGMVFASELTTALLRHENLTVTCHQILAPGWRVRRSATLSSASG